MIKHNLKVGYRNLIRRKGYSLINISGLTVGMVVAMLIGFWVNDELSYDKHHENYGRIAQVMQHQTYDGNTFTQEAVPMPLDAELRTKYGSDFKYLVMSSWIYNNILSHGDKKLSKNGAFMDVDAPHLLLLNMEQGTLDGLKEPGSILLSSSTAKALFGETDPMDRMIKINNNLNVMVTGIYRDLPYNSRFKELTFIAPWQLYVSSEPWIKDALDNPRWDNNSFQCFVQIADNADMQQVSHKIKRVKYDNVSESDKTFNAEIFLFPMKDWHLRSSWENGIQSGGLIQYVWLFGVIGAFVLILACINFMNLSTAQSERRSKEVGIRKSIGSVKSQLIGQFLSESFLIVIMAFFSAIILVYILIPSFNQLADKRIAFPLLRLSFWIISLGFVLVTGFLSSSYPAFYLSSFNPIKVLKGTFKVSRSATSLRKVLVVLQFTISVILIIGTVVVENQVQFSKDRPLGFDKDGIVMIEMISPEYYGKYDLLRNELKTQNAIVEMAQSTSPLTEVYNENGGFSWEGKDPSFFPQFATIWVTQNFGQTINWEILDGRDFSSEMATDSAALIINEAAVKYMGIRNPVGTAISWGTREYTIIGVVKDMLMESPFKSTKQTVYSINRYDDDVNYMELKLNPNKSASASLAIVKDVFSQFLPNVPFEYTFADEEHARKFAAVERIGKLSGIFAILAIFISCLGLFGLASFMAEKRTKEIGIRKILGATGISIWQLLSKEFVLLVIISCILSIPIAFYALTSWLQNYEYRTGLHWWIFALAVVVALFITLLTVSFQAIKAAAANPVESLRNE